MKTKHRKAARAKRATLALVPKYWLPKLAATNRLTLQVIHVDNLNPMVNGTATKEDLMDWMESAYTYVEAVPLFRAEGLVVTDEEVAPLAAQMAIHDAVMTRYEQTGSIGFSGTEYSIARVAAEVMDDLTGLNVNGALIRAVVASEPKKAGIRARMAKVAPIEGVAA